MVDVSTDGEYWRGTLPRPLAAALGCVVGGVRRSPSRAPSACPSRGRSGSRRCRSCCPWWSSRCSALVLALRPVAHDDPDVLGPRLGFAWLPEPVRRAVRPGLVGAGVLLGVGAAVVLTMVAVSWHQVTTISTAVAAGGLGGIVLALAQVASLPNLALWAVSFMAGPGSGSSRAARSAGRAPRVGCCRWSRCWPRCRSPATSRGSPRSRCSSSSRWAPSWPAGPSPRSPGCLGCAPSWPSPCRPAPSPPSPSRRSTSWPVARRGSSGSRPWAPRPAGFPRPAPRARHRGPGRRAPRRLAAAPLSTGVPDGPLCTVPD